MFNLYLDLEDTVCCGPTVHCCMKRCSHHRQERDMSRFLQGGRKACKDSRRDEEEPSQQGRNLWVHLRITGTLDMWEHMSGKHLLQQGQAIQQCTVGLQLPPR